MLDDLQSAASSHQPRLVIFGCGYLGARIAREAIARGWTVWGVTRNADAVEQLSREGVHMVQGELSSDAWHARLPEDEFEYVVNCVSSAGGGLPGYWASYVEGTQSILRWAATRRCGTFVYTGSASVYAQHRGEVVTEDSPVGGRTEVAEPLLEAERLIRESRCFRRWFILRLTALYGPGRHYMLDQIRGGAGRFPGKGGNRLNVIHRDDAAAAVLACLDAPPAIADRIYNVSSDEAATKADVAAWLARAVGAPPPLFGDSGARESGRLRGRSGPVPDRFVSNQRIRRELGWRPRFPDFRAGYRQVFVEEGIPVDLP
ncbi:MAG: NAD-dependent epimerase/dehydratase family protein [Verrucomicrobia bacterium]|nr:MAG: NAD-dependent epimerase/dehydratase family protein [Verrucomicrobiota bacterium]